MVFSVFVKQASSEREPFLSEVLRIGEIPLLERDSANEPWALLWDDFRFFVGYLRCPVRIELHNELHVYRVHFKIKIPPDASNPRATKWRTLFAGELTDDVESFFTSLSSEFVMILRIDPATGKPNSTSRRLGA